MLASYWHSSVGDLRLKVKSEPNFCTCKTFHTIQNAYWWPTKVLCVTRVHLSGLCICFTHFSLLTLFSTVWAAFCRKRCSPTVVGFLFVRIPFCLLELLQFFTVQICCVARSKLKVEDLKEAQMMAKDAQWTEDKEATHCRLCTKMFSVSRRKVNRGNKGNIYICVILKI